MKILKDVCKEIRQVSIDEAYIDVSNLISDTKEETVKKFCVDLQRKILEETQLPISIGGSHTEAIAKICSQLAKPHGIKILSSERFREELDPLQLNIISGVGKKTFSYLQSRGYSLIGDIAKKRYTKLSSGLRWIWLTAHGIVLPQDPNQKSNRSHSKERTFNKDVSDHILLRKIVRKLITSLMVDLKSENFRTLSIKIRDSTFQTYTRSKSFQYFINPSIEDDIKRCIITGNEMLNEFLVENRAFRLLGVKASNFKESDLFQTSLFDFIQ